jgi:catalase
MADKESVTRRAPLSPAAAGGRFAVIGGVLLASALAFAYVGGWLTPDRLTPGRMVAALAAGALQPTSWP